MTGRSKLLTWGLPTIGLVALIGGAGLVYQNRPITPEESPPRQPTTAPTEVAGLASADFVGAVGVSEPPGESIEIGAHVAGIITSVDVAAGQVVAAGDVLFTVDNRRVESDVALRESESRVAQSDVDALRGQVPVREAAVASARAGVAAAQARVRELEAMRDDRINQLRIAESVDDPRAISAEEVDRRRFAVLAAEAQLADAQASVAEARAQLAEASAQRALLVADDGADGPDLRAAIQRVELAERELDRSRVDRELLSVRAPVDAEVLRVNVRPGEFAPAASLSEGLVVLGRTGGVHLRVEIDEVDIPRFTTGARAWASPRGDATRRHELDVVLVEPLIVPKTNLAGRTSELIDMRVLQVVYRFGDVDHVVGFGRQFDVYIETTGDAP